MLSVITTLEFFQHYFAKMGHRNTSCDPHLHPSHQATNAPLPHAKRPPPGGYVQTPKPDKSNWAQNHFSGNDLSEGLNKWPLPLRYYETTYRSATLWLFYRRGELWECHRANQGADLT